MNRTGYSIGGKYFRTKSDITKECQRICNSVLDGELIRNYDDIIFAIQKSHYLKSHYLIKHLHTFSEVDTLLITKVSHTLVKPNFKWFLRKSTFPISRIYGLFMNVK